MTTHRRPLVDILIMLALLTLLGGLLPGGHAYASGGGEKKEEGGDPYVKLAQVAIPVLNGGRVTNYIYLSVKLNLSPKANMTKLREKEPYFRDALVRTAYKVPLGQEKRDDLLDEPKFQATLKPVFSEIAGPGAIASIEILSQMPNRQRGRMPPPAAHP